ncbi:MAG: PHP domain-containing protein [Clostridiales bacterium]|jgi:putative hydrolase|nr:PHP domain-containing protein [Clostridiales bacterium]
MTFYGDYHTHTRYSDGKNSIEENVAAAVSKGLKEIAVTDHGFRNMFCLKISDIQKQKKEIDACRIKYPNIKILHGIEADLVGTDGRIDLTREQFGLFDLVIAGYHPSARPYTLADMYGIHLKTYFSVVFKPTKEIIRQNTRAAIKMLERYKIDIYPHINHSFYVDIKEVAKVCADTGTYMELNAKHLDAEICKALFESDARLVANTDAHSSYNVGAFGGIESFITENGFDINRIENLKKGIELSGRI